MDKHRFRGMTPRQVESSGRGGKGVIGVHEIDSFMKMSLGG